MSDYYSHLGEIRGIADSLAASLCDNPVERRVFANRLMRLTALFSASIGEALGSEVETDDPGLSEAEADALYLTGRRISYHAFTIYTEVAHDI